MGKHKNSVNSTEQTLSEILGPCVHLPSGTGWCEAKKKSSHEIHQFSTSSQSFPMYQFYLPSWCLAEPCRDHQPSHCRVFSSRTSMSVFLKTTPSVPTPGYFTSFRISVDSTPDAGKDWNRLMACYVDHDGGKPTSWRYSGTFCVPSLPAFWNSVHIYC